MHLQIVSQFSLLRSTIALDNLVARAQSEGLTALSLTDHNALYAVVQFDQACRNAGIRPIIGLTLTVGSPSGDPGAADLILLACNHDGYRALCRLSTSLQAVADREQRIAEGLPWRQLVAEGGDNLIAVDAGRRGWLYRHLLRGDIASAQSYAAELRLLFGQHTYLGLEIQTTPQLYRLPPQIAEIGAALQIPLVALQPVFCLDPSERSTLHLLHAIEHNTTVAALSDVKRIDDGDASIDVHWLDSAEMQRRFADYPHALANVDTVVAQCDFELPIATPVWPHIDLEAGVTPDAQLRIDSESGLITRFGISAVSHKPRLQHELEAIRHHGFAPFFLVVADIVLALQRVPIHTWQCRNSLVAYCLGISTVDRLNTICCLSDFSIPPA